MHVPGWIDHDFYDRSEDARKRDFGSVAVVGGAERYPNTPGICGSAAVRTGADIIYLLAPERAADISAGYLQEFISEPLPGERIREEHCDTIREVVTDASAIVVGNGLGREQESFDAVVSLLQDTDLPVVIDGDALQQDLSDIDFADREVVLTPHRGEFERLYEEPEPDLAVLKEQVRKAARVYGATMVVKGARDVISDGETVAVNKTGNPFMTKGGTGDVLAGVCGALLSQGVEQRDAAYLAACLTGVAGDVLVEQGDRFFTISELVDAVPEAVDRYQSR